MTRARAAVFIATSLDGFIAREDGGIDWLLQRHARIPAGEDCGYAAFMAGIDRIVMGRLSFEQVVTFEPWPYDKPVLVLSRRGVAVPAALADRVSVSAETPRALLERLGAAGERRVYVDGGQLIQSFLREGLIDEMTVTTIPVLIGQGRPLFGALAADVDLEPLETRSWDFGFVQTRWRVGAGAPVAPVTSGDRRAG